MKTNIQFLLYLSEYFLECEMLQRKVVWKLVTHILCPIIFFFENLAVYELMWKNVVEWGRP